MSKELKAAAEEYAIETDRKFEYAVSWEENVEIFKAGARWQEERDRVELAEAKSEIENRKTLITTLKNAVDQHVAEIERLKRALEIIADDIDMDTHISKKQIAREALES